MYIIQDSESVMPMTIANEGSVQHGVLCVKFGIEYPPTKHLRNGARKGLKQGAVIKREVTTKITSVERAEIRSEAAANE